MTTVLYSTRQAVIDAVMDLAPPGAHVIVLDGPHLNDVLTEEAAPAYGELHLVDQALAGDWLATVCHRSIMLTLDGSEISAAFDQASIRGRHVDTVVDLRTGYAYLTGRMADAARTVA